MDEPSRRNSRDQCRAKKSRRVSEGKSGNRKLRHVQRLLQNLNGAVWIDETVFGASRRSSAVRTFVADHTSATTAMLDHTADVEL